MTDLKNPHVVAIAQALRALSDPEFEAVLLIVLMRNLRLDRLGDASIEILKDDVLSFAERFLHRIEA